MSRLVLALDTSGSMMRELENSQGKLRIDMLKEQVKNLLLPKSNWELLRIYSFTDAPKLVGDYSDPQDACRAIDAELICSGLTSLAASLDQIACDLERSRIENTPVICITDGCDGAWKNHKQKVMQRFSQLNNVSLHILVIGESDAWHGTDEAGPRDQDRIRHIDDWDNIRVEVEKIMEHSFVETLAVRNYPGTVLPIVPCDEAAMRDVRETMRKVVPYLEELTGLRYYPVPTLLVDRWMLDTLGYKESIKDPDIGREELIEILRFLDAVCLSYHVGGFSENWIRSGHPIGTGKYGRDSSDQYDPEQECYGNWLSDTTERREWIWSMAELTAFSLRDYIIGKELNKGLAAPKNAIDMQGKPYDTKARLNGAMEILQKIAGVLETLARKNIPGLLLLDDYFQRRGSFDTLDRDHPDLTVWQRHLTKREFNRISKCIREDRCWKKDIGSIAIAFRISITILAKHLPQMRMQEIARQIRTWGVYLPPAPWEKLHKLLIQRGFPEWFSLGDGGKVLLCIEDCKKAVQETGDESLWPKFLLPVLVHEHAHAIATEGISTDQSDVLLEWQGNCTERLALSESLAEWAELDFCREDEQLLEIVRTHALSGDFPEWPYAGALLVEKLCQKSGIDAYRTLLKSFRAGSPAGMKRLKEV